MTTTFYFLLAYTIELIIGVCLRQCDRLFNKLTKKSIKIEWVFLKAGTRHKVISSQNALIADDEIILTRENVTRFLKVSGIKAANIVAVKLDDMINRINPSSFRSFISLRYVKWPKDLKMIGSCAFYNCISMRGKLVLPKKVISIGYQSFYGCNFDEIEIPRSLIDIFHLKSLYPYDIDFDEIDMCYTYKEDPLEHMIAPSAFEKNYHLSCVYIDPSEDLNDVTWSISDTAFQYCHMVSKVVLKTKNSYVDIADNRNILQYFSDISYANICILTEKFGLELLTVPTMKLTMNGSTSCIDFMPYLLAEYLKYEDFVKLDPRSLKPYINKELCINIHLKASTASLQ